MTLQLQLQRPGSPHFKLKEYLKFNKQLMANAPDPYVPHYFPVMPKGKNPNWREIKKRAPKDAVAPYSWKAKHARLSVEEAVELIKRGGNVGIAGTATDPLVIIDGDNPKTWNALKLSLKNRSRSRVGGHGFYFEEGRKICNIPTDTCGEVRCRWQYVLTAGSYVPCTEKDLQKLLDEGEITSEEKETALKDPALGFYTVENNLSPVPITFEELPKVFRQAHSKTIAENKRVAAIKIHAVKPTGKHSALFDLKIENIVHTTNAREAHPLHPSDTGQNFSIKGGLAHCWRHDVSLNALQFLVVKSGFMDCAEAGTGHKGGNASAVIGNNGAVFHAWLQAKKDGLIPENDPIPVRAMQYIAEKHELLEKNKIYDWNLPTKIYNKVIEIVEKEY